MRYNVVFHPSWWHVNEGIDFSEFFWADPDVRIASDIKIRRALYQRFGKYDLGEQNPEPRPLMGSDMLACGYLSSQILGCQVDFAPDDSPEVHCANLDDEAAFLSNSRTSTRVLFGKVSSTSWTICKIDLAMWNLILTLAASKTSHSTCMAPICSLTIMMKTVRPHICKRFPT